MVGCKTTTSEIKSSGNQGINAKDVAFLAIHPGIGVARMGNNKAADGFYIGPEVVAGPYFTDLPSLRDPKTGAINRQAARFRVYAYNAQKEVIGEVTAADAKIEWKVTVANRKADWFQFRAALDIPESNGRQDMILPRRNPLVTGNDRATLAITPKPQTISGASQSGPQFVGQFDATPSGPARAQSKPVDVYLGELRTDDAGRLVFLGGYGVAGSPAHTPIFNEKDLNSFNNADGWYDDTCDGVVEAKIILEGKTFEADQAWVIVAPPNYAPDVIGWRTLYDLLMDAHISEGYIEVPKVSSFQRDIMPIFARLAELQWVNQGFAETFVKSGPYDFLDPKLLAAMADPSPANQANRKAIFDKFRFPNEDAREKWPQLYGDAFGSFEDAKVRLWRNELPIDGMRAVHLKRWLDGKFVNDFQHEARQLVAKPQEDRRVAPIPQTDPLFEAKVPVAEQPEELDRAALDYCLADAFHPGCELTYPMRRPTMYRSKFRIVADAVDPKTGEYVDNFTATELKVDEVSKKPGPFHAQIPGSVSRWMAIPWQGDTVFCRSGYDPQYHPFLPAYWPARVPNQVLTEDDYLIVMDTSKAPADRMKAFANRESWVRSMNGGAVDQMEQMVREFGEMGIVVAMPGPTDGKISVPSVLLVEFLPKSKQKNPQRIRAASFPMPPPKNEYERKILEAGWPSVQVFEQFKRIRRMR